MDDALRSSIYLKGILPLMEDLVRYDRQAAAAVAGQDLVLQFEVKGGPVAHLVIRDGQVQHGAGPHPRPDVRLTFKSPTQLNRLFDGEQVRPGIRKGWSRLRFLTRGFPLLAGRLGDFLAEAPSPGEESLEAQRFRVGLGLRALLGGMAVVANDDATLAACAAATPAGVLLVRVPPDGPQGTFEKLAQGEGGAFRATWQEEAPGDAPGQVRPANAVMEFRSLEVAGRVLAGDLSPVVAIGCGEMRIGGYLPLIEKANLFLGRFARLMRQGTGEMRPKTGEPGRAGGPTGDEAAPEGQVVPEGQAAPEGGAVAGPPAATAPPERYRRSIDLFLRAARVIPEGIYGHKNPAFLLAGACPYYAQRAEGGHYWDVDGHEYIDFLCGYGPVLLGHNHPEVEEAVRRQMARGACFNHPGEAMVELAERLVALTPGMGWAVMAKNGSDVTTWAIRVAREQTGREKVVMVRGAYHGAHAWCSPYSGGVLSEERQVILSMGWNRLDELEQRIQEHPGQIAAVILTPYHHPTYARQEMPAAGFWAGIRQICNREGMLLILDDIRACFRLSLHGSQAVFGIEPDLVCYAKAMANGHPLATALGRDALRDAAEAVFLSGTFWFTPAPMVAALATLRVLEESGAQAHMARLGMRLMGGLEALAASHGLRATASGPPALPYLTFDDDPDLYTMQAFCREMIARGVFLHPHHNWFLCAAHTDADVDQTLEMADACFRAIR
jgi:glutamate-1-semialdehyde 2,1-aminomutase